jgi:hypothetical protein
MAHRQALSALVYLTLILLPSTSDADSPGGVLMLSGNGSGFVVQGGWRDTLSVESEPLARRVAGIGFTARVN